MTRRVGAVLAVLLCLSGLPAPAGAEAEPEDGRTGWSSTAVLGQPRLSSARADGTVDAAGAAGSFEATECFTPLPEGAEAAGVRCGYVTVPADHADPEGPTIRLAVAVRSATGPDAVDDPLLVLGGGPGEHLVVGFPTLLADGGPFDDLLARRDIVLLDQRGVGFSQPALDCPETLTVTPDLGGDVMDAFTAAIAECRARLVAAGVDLSAFDTLNNAADLDLVRAALGYETWNVFGTSYGARLALQAARSAPAAMRSMALSSPIPAEANFVRDAGSSVQRALDELFAACASDEVCAARFGDLEATLDGVLADLAEEPVVVDVTDPNSGEVIEVPVTAGDVASLLFSAFYASPLIPAIPALVDGMAGGDFRTLLELALGTSGQQLLSQGMQLSSMCAEEVDRTSPAEVVEGAAGLSSAVQLLIATNPIIGLPVFDLCEIWDVEPADPLTFIPITSDVPALVVTGRFDQITPPAYGETVAAALSEHLLVEFADQGHSPLLGSVPCGTEILAAFLDFPPSGVDTACATERQVDFVEDLPPVPQARSVTDACPSGVVPTAIYDDVATGVHRSAIECITWWGISEGRSEGRYEPRGVVTRGQMASFVARLIETTGGELPDDPEPLFDDTAGSVHAADIDRLGAAGVVVGRGDGTFGTGDPLTRGQMATLLVRAYEHRVGAPLPPGRNHFVDDDDSVHLDSINTAAAAGFVQGYPDRTYRPEAPLRRDAIASFLARELDLLVEEGVTAPPSGPA